MYIHPLAVLALSAKKSSEMMLHHDAINGYLWVEVGTVDDHHKNPNIKKKGHLVAD